ncbi:MAG TPA: phosphoribosylformylglycinamidine cyclo-ligase [Clostridiales bacterium]|jgi:phosphoribosylformylglycinamidine cyclo-ligase|nr:phosphoribosylformylglycinamidine cyclo-ligase [Clostridiales bacterium]HPZ05301.1 phosphoribosylformylglycinamidine cyclo-ligase [Clostridiales bacterium]
MIDYKSAGVDVEAGYEAVRLMREDVRRTFRPEVLTDIGGFGGLFALDKSKYEEPVLVSGTDGVGTKLKIAFMMDKHETIGIDAVAMCVNDIICGGAEPLFFLDYIAVGKNRPEQVAEIVKGVADGCVMAGCALIGGETAEMPGFYSEDEYDIAGFAVGIVDRKKIIDGKGIREGDKLVGLASSGLHSNGFSLVRKVLNPNCEKLSEHIGQLNSTLGDELLKPTRIYVKSILDVKDRFNIKGIANITGGGFIENIPRMLPDGLRARIDIGSWPVLPIFTLLQEAGNIALESMFNTFNMGIGMVLAVEPSEAEDLVSHLQALGEKAYIIGEIISGEKGIDLYEPGKGSQECESEGGPAADSEQDSITAAEDEPAADSEQDSITAAEDEPAADS